MRLLFLRTACKFFVDSLKDGDPFLSRKSIAYFHINVLLFFKASTVVVIVYQHPLLTDISFTMNTRTLIISGKSGKPSLMKIILSRFLKKHKEKIRRS